MAEDDNGYPEGQEPHLTPEMVDARPGDGEHLKEGGYSPEELEAILASQDDSAYEELERDYRAQFGLDEAEGDGDAEGSETDDPDVGHAYPKDRVAPTSFPKRAEHEEEGVIPWIHHAAENDLDVDDIPTALQITDDTAARAANVAFEEGIQTDEELVKYLLDRAQGGGGKLDRMSAAIFELSREIREQRSATVEAIEELGQDVRRQGRRT